MSVRIIGRSVWTNPGNRHKRLRMLMAAASWQFYKRSMKRPKTMTLVNGAKFRAYPDCVISSALHYADWPEFAELRYCRKLLNSNDVIFDVGANVGHFSLLLSDVGSPENTFCFEPTPVTWRRLRENFDLNGWPTTRLYHSAVGQSEGTLRFPDTDSPLTTNSAAWRSPNARQCDVRVVPLDSFVPELSGKEVGLLKIDVEGFEREVFLGAQTFLKDCRPRLVMFESLGGRLDEKINDILSRAGYTVFQLDADGHPIKERLDAQNLFAAPAEVQKPFEI